MKSQSEQAGPYSAAVKRFADAVLERGRDTYGGKKTPLFVDGLHAETLEPATWIWKGGQCWILCNQASQQPLYRLLDGLTAVGGDGRYRAAAEEAMRYALANLRTPNGLLYWGGHAAWDLLTDAPCGTWYGRAEQGVEHYNHELKAHQPYYELMWRVNPAAAKTLMERIWGGHILDWSLLDYNRHAETWTPLDPQWDAAFVENLAVPFPSQSDNLSFCQVVPPFLHAGVLLTLLGGDPRPLAWSRRLAYRWQQARDPGTGLCGGQMSYRLRDRAWEALGHVHPAINEAKIVASYHQLGRYHILPLAQMQAGESLLGAGGAAAQTGRDFIAWASGDLAAYGRECFDPARRMFIAKMTDGTPLKWRETKTDYYRPEVFAPCRPDGWLFWSFALAYRLTREPAHWRMLAALAPEFGLTGLGADPNAAAPAFQAGGRRPGWQILYALIELARATGNRGFLEAGCQVADDLLRLQAPSGLFTRPPKPCPAEGEQLNHALTPGVPSPAYAYGRTGDEIPLAILHLAAALEGKSAAMPQPVMDERYLHCPYFGPLEPHQKKINDTRTYDWLVFYGEE